MRIALAALLVLLMPGAAWGQDAQSAAEAEWNAAMAAARKVHVAGPSEVKLVDQATFKLPEGFIYIPAAEAKRLLVAMGNRVGNDILGVVFPASDARWFVVMRFHKSGYIRDDDARNWNTDELLTSLKAGTEQSNAERRARGIGEIEVVGWVEVPAYDAAKHRLVWSLSSREKNEPAGAERGINYNIYALGREGYVSMNFVTGMKTIEAEKPIARTLLAALEYNDGKRYRDFNAKTDHVAEYGLAALIGGVAAKKLGLFAVAAAFLAKFAKVIGIAVIALGAAAAKMFRRRKEAESAPTLPA
jgi:uncharacterized membrane-anchored protein